MITGYERQRLASECRSMAYRHEFTAEAVADVLGLTLSGTTRYDHDAWYRLADLISPGDSDVRAAWVKSPVSRAQVSYFRDKMLMLAGRIEGDAESEENCVLTGVNDENELVYTRLDMARKERSIVQAMKDALEVRDRADIERIPLVDIMAEISAAMTGGKEDCDADR